MYGYNGNVTLQQLHGRQTKAAMKKNKMLCREMAKANKEKKDSNIKIDMLKGAGKLKRQSLHPILLAYKGKSRK